jgi:hypothetical protein
MTVLEEAPVAAHPWYQLEEATHLRKTAASSQEFVRAYARERVLRRQLEERLFTTKRRAALEKKGHAMPGGRYPIETPADLANAIQAFGRGNPDDKGAIKAFIIKRAKALGLTGKLPAGWATATA